MTAIEANNPALFTATDLPGGAPLERFQQQFDELITKLQALDKQTPVGGAPALDRPVMDHSADNLAILLNEIRDKLGEIQLNQSKEDVHTNLNKKKKVSQERLDKIQEAIDKMNRAKKSSFWGRVFSIAATVVFAAVAVGALVATGGAAAPLVAVAMFNIAILALQETGQMDKLQEWLADKTGSDLAASLIITGTIILVNLAGGFAGGSAVAGKLGETATKVMIAAQVSGGLAQAGSGAANTASAVYTADSMRDQADAMDLAAKMKRLAAMLEDEMDRIQEVIEQMDSVSVMVMDMLRGNSDAYDSIQQKFATV